MISWLSKCICYDSYNEWAISWFLTYLCFCRIEFVHLLSSCLIKHVPICCHTLKRWKGKKNGKKNSRIDRFIVPGVVLGCRSDSYQHLWDDKIATLTHCVLVKPYCERSGSTLAQVMACCLTAPSHYLNQCRLIICEVSWHSPEGNFTGSAQGIYPWYLVLM